MTDPTDAELVERLKARALVHGDLVKGLTYNDHDAELDRQAASRLSSLVVEVRRLETEVLNAAFSDRLDMEAGGSPLTWKEVAEAAEARVSELEGRLAEADSSRGIGRNITFHPFDPDSGNAVVSPQEPSGGGYWTLIGQGDEANQNAIAAEICRRLNAVTAAPGDEQSPAMEGVAEVLESVAKELDAARTLVMNSGWWFNAAGIQTDAALWIDRADNSASQLLAQIKGGKT